MTDQLEPLHRVADRLCVQTRTLVVWSQAGKFPRIYHIGRRWMVRAADVDAWMDGRAIEQRDAESRVRRDWADESAKDNVRRGGREIRTLDVRTP